MPSGMDDADITPQLNEEQSTRMTGQISRRQLLANEMMTRT